MFHRYISKDNWLVKLLAGAALSAGSFFYLLEGPFVQNIGLADIVEVSSQSAQAVCPDYMRAQGGCAENGFDNDSTNMFGGPTDMSTDSVAPTSRDAVGEDSISEENSPDVSVAVTSNTEASEGFHSVSIGHMSIGEMGRNVTEAIGENTISVSYTDPLGYAISVSLSIDEETNTVTAVRSVNENITEISLSITETEEGMTMSVTSIDINGIESTKTIDAQVNEDGTLSFYSVEEDGTRSFISTIQQNELGLGLPSETILGSIADAVMGVVNAVVDTVAAAIDAIGSFLGFSAPDQNDIEGFNEDGFDGDSRETGANDTTDAESSNIGNSIGDSSVDAAESDSGASGSNDAGLGEGDSGTNDGNADGGMGDTGSDGGGGGTGDGDGGSGGDSGGGDSGSGGDSGGDSGE